MDQPPGWGDEDLTAPRAATPGVPLGIPGLGLGIVIGSGGFGTVYRAAQPDLDRTVAVKVLTVQGLDADARRRFEREARTMGALSGHPAIVGIVSAGFTPESRPYIVMEDMTGGSLAERVRDHGPMPWRDVARSGAAVASALQAAHAAGVLHRDLKPENVLVSRYGDVKLADFGIARLLDGGDTRTVTPMVTVAHAAPEVLSGEDGGAAADVYSLGSTLATLALGEAPFRRRPGEPFAALLSRIIRDPAPDLAAAGVHPSLAAILQPCMAKRPAERPTVGALADALRHLDMSGESHSGPRPAPEDPTMELPAPQPAAPWAAPAPPWPPMSGPGPGREATGPPPVGPSGGLGGALRTTRGRVALGTAAVALIAGVALAVHLLVGSSTVVVVPPPGGGSGSTLATTVTPPRLGTYTYQMASGGTETVRVADGGTDAQGNIDRDLTSTSSVSSTTQSLSYASDGVRNSEVVLHLNAGDFDCLWSAPYVQIPLPLVSGATWSFDASCSQTVNGTPASLHISGSGTVLGSGSDTVGGTQIAVVKVRTQSTLVVSNLGGSAPQTITQTEVDDVAPTAGLPVTTTLDVQGGSGGPPHQVLTLQSLSPA